MLFFSHQLFAQNTTVLSESFDGGFPPSGWTNTAAGSGLNWARVTTSTYPSGISPRSGSGLLRLNCYSVSSGTATLISSSFSLAARGTNNAIVSVWVYRENGYSTDNDSISVRINTSSSVTGATYLGFVSRSRSLAPVVGSDGWYKYDFNLPGSFNTGTNYLIIEGTSKYGNDIHIDDVSCTIIGPMAYSSSTTNQASTNPLGASATNQVILSVPVTVSGSATTIALTGINFNTTGTTNVADISGAKVYFTGSNATFSTTTQFGSTVSSPSGAFSVTGSQNLADGVNYFWLAYDISATPGNLNLIDAQCTQVTVGGTNYTPTITNPSGSRQILFPLSGVYNVGVSGTFSTLTAAITALNSVGVGAPVTFNLTDNIYGVNETFPIVINQFSGGSAVNTVTIKPASGVDATITGNASSILSLNGADFVTIDGSNSGTSTRNLSIINSNTASSSVVLLASLGTAAGATNNTIKNCNISNGATNVVTYGISIGGATPGSTGADNDNNTVQNNIIGTVTTGIYAIGTSSGSTGGNDNLNISGNTVSFVSSISGCYGIRAGNTLNSSVSLNNISIETSSGTMVGISLETGFISSVVNRNLISKVKATSTSALPVLRGITLATGQTGSSVTISNNVIYDVIAAYSTTNAASNCTGIMLGAVGVSTTTTTTTGGVNMYHNSINLTGNVNRNGSCLQYGVFVGANVSSLDFRNNVISNAIVNINATPGTSKSFAVYSLAANTAYSNMNNNCYFVGATQGVLGYIGATDRTTLAAIQTGFGQNASSISSNPLFNASNNLRPTASSPLLNAGVTIAGQTTDFRGTTRSVTTPTIGAYELGGEFLLPVISFTTLSNTASTANRVETGFATITDASGINITSGTRPRLYFKKSTNANTFAGNTSADNGWKWVEATDTISPFDFTIDYSLLTSGGVTQGDMIQYFVVAQDMASVPNVTVANAQLLSEPASVNLNSSHFPASGNINSYTIAFQLSGTYLVGTGQTFTSLTNTGGLFQYLNNNVIAGDVVALITSNLSETGAIALNQTSEFGGSNFKISIQPSAPSVRTISGNYVGGLIRLNGADRVSIDGRFNNSGTGNYLTIVNSATSGVTAAVQLSSLGNGQGATNNTIRNCTFSLPRTGPTSIGIAVGGVLGNTGSDNDSLAIMNNVIRSGAYGIYVGGNVAPNTTDEVVITSNIIGGDTLATSGALLANLTGLTCNNNTISNVLGTAALSAISLNAVRNASFSSNTITNIQSTGSNPVGLSLVSTDSNIVVSNNTIKNVFYVGTSGYGGKGIDVNTTITNSRIVIVNNVISNMSGDGWTFGNDIIAGIRVLGTSGGVSIRHNTVSLSGTISRSGAATDISAALVIGSSTVSNVEVLNNIFRNSLFNTTGTQTSYAVYNSGASTVFSNIGYNNYTAVGSQSALGYQGSTIQTLSAWKAAVTADVSSQSRVVSFVDTANSNLRLTGSSNGDFYLRSVNLNNSLTNADYDNVTRRPISYMGAFEGSTPLNMSVNAGVDTAVCSGSSVQIGGASIVTGGIAPYTYAWSPSAGNTSNPSVSPATNTSYIVTATDTFGFVARDTVFVTVNSAPNPPSASAASSICSGDSTNLTASGTGTFIWYKNATGGSALGAGATYNTGALTANDSFYVSVTNAQGCTSTRTKVNVVVNSPAAPTASNASTCSGTAAVLNATGTGTFSWFKNPTGGTALGTGSNYTTAALTANDSFYVSVTTAGCTSARTKVNVTVLSNPAAPNVAVQPTICTGSTATIISDITAGSRKWYTAATGGTSIYTGDTLVTGVLTANANYYVENNVNSCISTTRTLVKVTVNALPTAPVITTPAAICSGNTAMIIANSGAGSRRWYTDATGGTAIYTGDTLTTSTLTANTTYYADNIENGCVSSTRKSVVVTVNAIPSLPSVQDIAICDGSTGILTATGFATGDSIMWYDAATNGNMLASGSVYTTSTLSANATYYAGIKSAAGCSNAARTSALVTVNPIPAAPQVTDEITCEGSTATFNYSSTSGNLKWYNDAIGGTPEFSGNVFTTLPLTSMDTFFVSVTELGCESQRNRVFAWVTSLAPVPSASNTKVCEGLAATLTATSGTADIFWYTDLFGGSPVDSGSTISVNGITQTSIYYAEARNGVCATAERKPVVVVFYNKPNGTFTVQSQFMGGITFAPTTANGLAYNWSFGDGNNSTVVSPTHKYTTNGNYNVKLVVVNPTSGCSDSSTQAVSVVSVGFADAKSNGFNAEVYPNPFTGSAQLSYTLPVAETVSIRVVNLLGQEVMQLPAGLKQAGTHQVDFNATNLSSGVYYVRLQVGNTQHTLRVVKAN
ncbi:MAG: BNR-repeat neuraminidase N-terminal domain-containing protein [Bacteroidia bacterium]